MSRWTSCWICAGLALVMFVLAWMVPAHLRATDEVIIARAGRSAPPLIEHGLQLTQAGKLGPAQTLLDFARAQRVAGADKLGLAVGNFAVQTPAALLWGAPEPEFAQRVTDTASSKTGRQPFTDLVVRLPNREQLLEYLSASRFPSIQELLRSRNLTNTTLIPASGSGSGQAFDTAVAVTGLLLDQAKLTPSLGEGIHSLAAQANRQGYAQRYEQLLLDFMSLGQRLDWGQLSAFVSRVSDVETIRLLATLARRDDKQLPVLFCAVELSGRPAEVCRFLMDYHQTGYADLGVALRHGPAGVTELLKRRQRLHRGEFGSAMAATFPSAAFSTLGWQKPGLALTLKWFLFLGAGFFVALAMHFARPRLAPLEKPLQVRGFHLARETLFALGFLVVVLLASEPYLAQESQKVEFPFRLRLPVVASTVAAAKTANITSLMHQMSLLTLLLFFVLQALIYTACLFKLAEIRRQNFAPRVKLRLLENEDHLFDAGLYLGFVGTIISLILVSLGLIKPSLMAAYSSTSFGIIFVSVFKIFNLRPVRRRLLLEAELGEGESASRPATAALATQS